MRKRNIKVQQNSGYFVDVKTIAAAQTSQSFTLGKLAEFLQTEHRKHSTDEYSGPLTDFFIAYAVEDVQVTWECYRILKEKYEQHELNGTLLNKVYSEASLGKASLKEMGIKPWREMQPDFPDHLTGVIMSTYYGGRSEVHIRRTPTQVLCCDFLSMYPTVCTLMGLWRFVTAKGMKWYENTSEIAIFLKSVTLSDLQGKDIWKSLTTLVQVLPEDDIFPIRAKYTDEAQATIGLNHLASKTPLWFTLADCITAKLLTGKCVKIVRAITFKPGEMQDNLKPLTITGSENYKMDPKTGDFYCSLIDCRNKIKAKLKHATGAEKDRLVSEQQTLKIMANATSYGIFVELNVEHLNKSEQRHCYGPSGEAFQITPDKVEEPGSYFHPLLAIYARHMMKRMHQPQFQPLASA